VMDDVLFNQWGNLAGATDIDFTTTYSGDATDFGSNMEQQNGFMGVFLLRKSGLWAKCARGGISRSAGQGGIRLSNWTALS
jgi:hypothetical protein